MPTENVLEVHHLAKEVGQGDSQLSILTGVELVVKPAQTLALIGESGSGKSTLLGILAGLDDGTRGEVSLLGQRLDQMDEEQRAALRARDVGFVFQCPRSRHWKTFSSRRCCVVIAIVKAVNRRCSC